MSDLTDWDDDILGEDETDEGIIELTSIVENEVDDETIIELTDIVEEDAPGLSIEITTEDQIEVEEKIEVAAIPDLSVTQEQVEAALERVIEKKFADKIEAILFEKMEKVIEREIADIKNRLQKDLDQIGNV
jgi:hypothetical protein